MSVNIVATMQNMLNPIESKEELYQKFLEEEARKGCMTLTLLAIALFPAFSPLDYFTQNDNFFSLSIIRFSTCLFFIVTYLLFKNGKGLSKPFMTGSFILGVASFSITIMCMVLNGAQSPYYAGVNLVLLAGVLILPNQGKHMSFTIAGNISIYVIGMLIDQNFQITNFQSFINNLYFLISTGIIGITASFFKDKIRKESFFRYLEIQRSMEVLQKELVNSQGSMESLAHEIVDKKMEVQAALELRDRFISIASHELRTPLTGMKLQLEVGKRRIQNNAFNDELAMKLIEGADSQVNRIVKIVDEMLDVSRIQSGKFVLERSKFNLSELLENILNRNFLEKVNQKQVSLEKVEKDFSGFWDPFKIEQVILNLVNNALLYGEGTPVTIRISTDEKDVVVSVEDKGPGIDKEYQAKLFEKFERGKTSDKTSGLGLGLYICKKIIEAHGGKIYLESEAGQGAKFICRLPKNF